MTEYTENELELQKRDPTVAIVELVQEHGWAVVLKSLADISLGMPMQEGDVKVLVNTAYLLESEARAVYNAKRLRNLGG